MKKLLLMTIALLAFGATMAAAQDTRDIEWGAACRTPANNTVATLNNQNSTVGGVPCNDSTDPLSTAPTRTLTMQFTPGTALPDFSGTTVQIDMTSPSGFANGSIWDFRGTGCNPGAAAAKPTLTTATGCTNPFAGDPSGQGNASNVTFTNTKISYINNRVRNTTIFALTAGTVYLADQMILDLDSAAQTQTCPGCGQEVDFFLTEVQYFSPSQTKHANNPGLKGSGPGTSGLPDCLGWNNPNAACNGATPAQRST